MRTIYSPKDLPRQQQRAQKHLDRKNDYVGSQAAQPHAVRRCALSLRTVLTAGTYLALIAGGQAANALATAPTSPVPALAPNRQARRALKAAVGSPPPDTQNTYQDVATRIFGTPPPFSNADLEVFAAQAPHDDMIEFSDHYPDAREWLVTACSAESARISTASQPFSDADLVMFGRASTSIQWSAMRVRYPSFGTWFQTAEAKLSGPSRTFPPLAPPPPAIPAGPPVQLTKAGTPNPDAFLRVWADGTTAPQFTTGDGPVRLVGYNVPTPGLGPCTVSLSDFQSLCATVADNGGNALRMFAFQGMGAPGNWTGLDGAVDAARSHGLKIDWVLGNQWKDCQNVEPGTASDGYHEPAWYSAGYKQVGANNTLSYRDFVLETVDRYKNESSIGMWTLLNEAEAGTVVDGGGTSCPDEAVAFSAMTSFVADMTSAIRGRDKNHLIALGPRGQTNNCGLAADHYLAVQAPVDVLTLHNYAMTYTRATDLVTLARGAKKALVLGEHAECVDPAGDCSWSDDPAAVQRRACDMDKFATGLAGLGVAGELVWSMLPRGSARDGYSIQPDDPLVARIKAFAAGGPRRVDEAC